MLGFIAFGIIFGGYTLIWYGVNLVKQYGLSLVDLVKPSALTTVNNAVG